MKKLTAALIAAAALLAGSNAMAQFAKPEDAIKYRKSALFVMQQNFARLAGMAQGRIPFDAKLAAASAENAEFVAKLPWAGFVDGSEKGAGSQAQAAIWSNRAKFDQLAEKLQADLARLNAAAKTGNLDNIKPVVGQVGGTCKACHDDFRAS